MTWWYENEEEEMKWHFVDKETPAEWGWYLVTIEYGMNGERCVDVGEFFPTSNSWSVHGEVEHHVIAWMPLPEPPQEEADVRD